MKHNKLRVLFFTTGTNDPPARFRVEQFLPYYRAAGFECRVLQSIPNKHYVPFVSNRKLYALLFFLFALIKAVIRFFELPLVPFYDVIFIQKEIIPYHLVYIERLIWLLNKNIIFDFDDAIFHYPNEFAKLLDRRNTVAKTIQLSKMTIVGNSFLANYARKYGSNVTIVPTAIDTTVYQPKPFEIPKNRPIVIGWMGTHSNLEYVYGIREALAKLSKKYPEQIQLKVVTDKFLYQNEISSCIATEYKKWSRENEISDLKSFDIGLMPLADNITTKGKCGFKLIQYMSVGVPAVASAIGANLDIVTDGKNGFLAKNNDEWFERLSTLIDNYDVIGKQFAKLGRDKIVNSYSVEAASDQLIDIIRSVAGTKESA